jgi:hypothetical protein
MPRRKLVGLATAAVTSAIAALGALSASGCESPTLPLPPPALPTVAAGPDANHVRLSSTCGGVESYSLVVIVNENIAVPGDQAVGGSIADACGAWDAIVYAHKGDVLDVTQEQGTNASTPVRVLVP